jgi:acetylornithine deacetylase/succinyl-diaminopimelate desuccinylase-like protein
MSLCLVSMKETDQKKLVTAVDEKRLLATATALVDVPSPTCDATAVATRLAEILMADGFEVERPDAGWPKAPAVVTRLHGSSVGRTLQFDGHLDTVHLPFVPASVVDGNLLGLGASDMKGGIAACVEAMRALRDADALQGGSVLLTTHDHHEAPWGDGRQVHGLIEGGFTGDAVLLPEYLAHPLPLAGRGMAVFEVTLSRPGEPVHEVLRPANQPNVVEAGAELVVRLKQLAAELAQITHPHAGRDTAFVGLLQAGEIYNQSPTSCQVKGTRRWVTPGQVEAVKEQLGSIIEAVAQDTGTVAEWHIEVPGDAFHIDETDPIVQCLQAASLQVSGEQLPYGGKPFVDDGNKYSAMAGIPALTHGPNATGAHTTQESVPVSELTRIAQVYALTAARFCAET